MMSMVLYERKHENISLSKVPGGSNIFQKESNCLFPIETNITCDFSRGGGIGGGGPNPFTCLLHIFKRTSD